jgi:hypothetical protein
MSDEHREPGQDDWESEGGAFVQEPNEERPKGQAAPSPSRNSILVPCERKSQSPKRTSARPPAQTERPSTYLHFQGSNEMPAFVVSRLTISDAVAFGSYLA